MQSIQSLTDKQLLRLFSRILDRIQSASSGGSAFGIDLRTLNVVRPDLAASYRIVRDESWRRKSVS